MKGNAPVPVTLNNALLNVITPMGLEIKRNSLITGENMARIYGVVKYPPTVEYGWLAHIMGTPGTVVSCTFTPADNTALMESISRNITQNRGLADSTKDPLTRQRAEKGAEDGERIMRQIDQQGEAVGYLSILVMPHAREDSQFLQTARRVESLFAAKNLKVRCLANLQTEGYQAISPYHVMGEKISAIVSRMMPLSTYMGGFPFSSHGYNDGTGYYFAKDASSGLIIIDPWQRGGDRTNTNMVIMGVAGVGKSTTVKHIMMSEYMRGTTVLCLDPEREYRDLTCEMDGNWINAGGGGRSAASAGGRINPLQVRPAPVDDEDENDPLYKDEGKGLGALALHIKNLEIFLSLYLPSLTDMQRVLLKQALEELYAGFGITWDTDVTGMANDAFPIFKDLYDLLLIKAEQKEKTRRENETNHFEDLACLFRDIAVGSDSFIWNGHTTLDADKQWVCLDTMDLQNTPDNIKKAAYFNVLSWCWERMSRDRTERVFFAADEAYLMIDTKVPQSLVFLRNVMKRSRKYEAAIAIISHSVIDFLDPSIRMYGQALLDIPCFKILMGTDGRNLHETAELFSLTDTEQAILYGRKRGHALVFIGSRRLHGVFDLPDYKLALMGRGGGR